MSLDIFVGGAASGKKRYTCDTHIHTYVSTYIIRLLLLLLIVIIIKHNNNYITKNNNNNNKQSLVTPMRVAAIQYCMRSLIRGCVDWYNPTNIFGTCNIHTHTHTHTQAHTNKHRNRMEREREYVCACVYVCMCVCVCVSACVCLYVWIHTFSLRRFLAPACNEDIFWMQRVDASTTNVALSCACVCIFCVHVCVCVCVCE